MAQQIGGKYSLERELDRGGMGSIWIAFDTKLRRRVALKLMRPDRPGSSGSHELFEREAMAIAQLHNPHVVQVYDYGIDGGSPYIVMELLEGEDLAARLHKRGSLPLTAVSQILMQAARALGAVHGEGIIHRDLKPANIFIVPGETGENVKILDFGVATVLQRQAALDDAGALQAIGTPSYMSPEQVEGRAADSRTDLWSLSVVAYHALTGQLPFQSKDSNELMVEITSATPKAPSTLVPELSPAVDRFFERALSKEPGNRFQSVGEMAAAFAALAEPRLTTKILVIDDEPDVETLMKARFRDQVRRKHYHFTFAVDGRSALEALRRDPDIEVALSDINMPGMDGLTFLRQAAEVSPTLKVIMVSAYSDMANIRAAMNRGAHDFLVKPIDFKDLEATIENASERVREIRRSIRATEENGILRMFVNDGIVDRLLPVIRAADNLAGEHVQGTVAFIDLCGFQRHARSRSADAAIRLLNANFEIIVPEITARGGVVDKFIGDAVMALFHGKDHGRRAVEASLAARDELSRLAERSGKGSPYGCGVSIGVASGDLISGSIGSRAIGRLDYTVLGAVVARAARLSLQANPGQILIDEKLHAQVHETFICEDGGRVSSAGDDEGRIFDVRSLVVSATVEPLQLPTVPMPRERRKDGKARNESPQGSGTPTED
ncbi:protein kinase domain-containing protein [Chondromyces crocatus]|uniref:Protein kinase n=1 Tax=Chondromyces crocatus TaxID=52 RepID=A0A0K1E8I2_CHOCO|nr:protein kinase [Chondromyces crocatus]AKT37165.1 protein kinase [Chondromyces crocatus]